MHWLKQIFRRRIYADLSEEIQEHLEEKIDELVAAGMSREEAAAAARREFGNALLLEERGRQVWRWPALDTAGAELRYAVRSLLKSPGFTSVCVLILALGIGANTAIFSLVDAVFFRPLPYPHGERLGALMAHKGLTLKSGQNWGEESDSIDGETWELLRDNVPAVQAAAYDDATGVNLQLDNTVRFVKQQKVSAHYFDVLGVHPLIGRAFTEAEDRPQGPDAVLLSYALWKSLFHLDPRVPGTSILLKGTPHIVVGVLPDNAELPAQADVWTPLRPSREGEGSGDNYGAILRLRDGMTWPQADTQLGRLRPAYLAEFLRREQKGEAWLHAAPLQLDLAREARLPAIILMSAVGSILLIACANLAGLMLVRVMKRSPEMATRLALGATRAAILRQILLEPLLLALAGAVSGVIAAWAIADLLGKLLLPGMLPVGGLHLDLRVVGFAVATSLCAALLIGLLPGLEASHVDLRTSMGGTSWTGAGPAGGNRVRKFLIAGEITLTVVLLSAAGLLVRTLAHLESLPAGFDASNVMTAQASLDDARFHDSAAFQRLLQASVSAMQRIPGVECAAAGLSLPYQRGLNSGVRIAVGPQAGLARMSSKVYVTSDYFRALRIPVLAGRAFAESDTRESELVAIVNVSFARTYLGATADAVGQHLKATKDSPAMTVVGVVADVAKRPGLSQNAPLTPSEPTYYIPAAQADQTMVNLAHTWFQPSWIIRTQGPIQGLAAAMQNALAEAAPALPFAGFHEMGDLQRQALERQRIQALLLGALAASALLLSIIGVYGLVANLVTQKTREIGIRMALGSTLQHTIVEIGKSGIWAALWGIATGLGFAAVAVRFIRSELYGVREYDPTTFVVTVGLLLAAVLLASYIPARRAAAIDPVLALRAD